MLIEDAEDATPLLMLVRPTMGDNADATVDGAPETIAIAEKVFATDADLAGRGPELLRRVPVVREGRS